MPHQFIRVRDRKTGHHYDVRDDAIVETRHEVLPDRPPSKTPRPAKPNLTPAPAPPGDPGSDAGAGDPPVSTGDAGEQSPDNPE